MFFRVIIPTYGNEPLLKDAIKSITDQTLFKKNEIDIVVVHDNSDTRPALDIEYNIKTRTTHVYSPIQRWNGGARNLGMEYLTTSPYTLFLDHDDRIPDNKVLEELKDFIVAHKMPDIVRLPYSKWYPDKNERVTKMLRDEKTMKEFINSVRVAPWTKCYKTSKMQEFPENTVFEDVVHHLKTCDICDSYALFNKPVVEWRMWEGQTSQKKGPKWESSKWRFIADLYDFEPKKKEVEKRRQEKIKAAIANLIKEQEK